MTHDPLVLVALRIDWRADEYLHSRPPMPVTERALRGEAALVRLAAAVVAAARAWRHGGGRDEMADLRRAVDAFEAAALPQEERIDV